jgi:hypothetical protein
MSESLAVPCGRRVKENGVKELLSRAVSRPTHSRNGICNGGRLAARANRKKGKKKAPCFCFTEGSKLAKLALVENLRAHDRSTVPPLIEVGCPCGIIG